MKIKIKRKIEDSKITPEKIIDIILDERKIKNKKEFLNPISPEKISLGDFFENKKKYKKDFKKTLELLQKLHREKKMIVVYTDYDADGITGGAILWETLHHLGFNVMPYAPDRKSEGYGFSKKGLDNVRAKFNPSLIISVDHGIVAADQISYAKKIGIPIIVTDHHLKSDKPPLDAFAVFHTDKVSGAGVSYFFSKEIYKQLKQLAINHKQLDSHFHIDYLAIASIGTIADMVPLVGPARSIAKYGLEAFSKSRRAGISHILKEAQIENRQITPYEIGFVIAPRINAFGRLGSALDGLRLLCTPVHEKAQGLAKKAGDTNRLRQDILTKALETAEKMVDAKSKIIILESKNWDQGIIGLIASRLAEKFYRPAIIMTKVDGVAKASARSIPGFDITQFLRSLKSYLIDVGGHKAAAGFTIDEKKIKKFTAEAEKRADKLLSKEDLIPTLTVDLELPLSMTSLSLTQKLEELKPFGVGNPGPVFLSKGEIVDARLLGKTQNHLKLFIKDENSFPVEMIFFGEGKQFNNLSRGQKIEVAYCLEIDRWDGREKVKGKIKYLV